MPAVTSEQVANIVDEHEIVRTINQWAQALDAGDFESFMDCYAPDGTMEVFHKGDPIATQEAFRAFMDLNVSQGAHLHLVCTPQVQLDGDRASAHSYVVRLDAYDDAPLIRAFATYRDEFVRSEDGRWRIHYRFVNRISFSSHGVDPSHPALIREPQPNP
ncbi:nuclear transport factor 2 family protein [Streptomyces sp. NPDC091217]|uniref:nuclear transport factor 2 family protein n=1 Tax=Streptomyces sp. NPDC091217 TaxID=3365975 RepID=UPI00381DEB0D